MYVFFKAFQFRLNQNKFPELGDLRKRERNLVKAIDGEMKKVVRKMKGSPEYVDYEGR